MLDELVNIYDDFTKNERTQSLSKLAADHNLPFQKRESFGNQSLDLRNFEIFKKKGVKRFLGIIDMPFQNTEDGFIRFYDYLITKDLETKTTSIIEIHYQDLLLDQFLIKPKSKFTRIFKFSKKNDLFEDFKTSFKYNSAINFTEQQMSILLENPKFTVEGNGSTFLFYKKNKQIDILDLFTTVDFCENFVFNFDDSDSDDFV